MTFNEHEALLRTIRSQDNGYDSSLGLYRTPFTKNRRYHTTIKQAEFVHGTHENALNALALLDSGLTEYREGAFDILGVLLSLQDQDPASATCGIWPYYYEEPLHQMNPPDWNFADFIGKHLILTLSRHNPVIPVKLQEGIRQAVCHAADTIIKRNVGPHYTNIAAMGAFVTLVGGELLGRDDYIAYGLDRLERLLAFTRRLNTFQEYNSPNYGIVTIVELSKLHKETRVQRAKGISEELLDIAWRMVSGHFHPSTGEWSGPHGRNYSTLLTNSQRSFIQYATKGAYTSVPWDALCYSTEWYESGVACPAQYLPAFQEAGIRTVRETIYVDEASGFQKTATAYISPSFCLGTFNREHLWNQCRSLVGYFDNQGSSAYLHARFLSDGYDFCSALLTCDQQEGNALFGINFFMNGGNTHPGLDPTKAMIHTSDLRMRFEFGGALQHTSFDDSDPKRVDVCVAGLTSSLRLLYSAFEECGPEAGRFEIMREIREQAGKLCVDYVLYSGPHRSFDMHSLNKAVLLFSLSIGRKPAGFKAEFGCQQDCLVAKGLLENGDSLFVALSEKPFIL